MSKIIFDVKDFLLKGQLASVKIDMTTEEVISHLGQPDGRYEDKEIGFIDFRYAWFEIFFYNFFDDSGQYKVAGFQNDSLSSSNGFDVENKNISVDTWFLYIGLGFEEAIETIKKEGLQYKIEKKYDFVFIVLESGGRIGFTKSDFPQEKNLILTVIDYHSKF